MSPEEKVTLPHHDLSLAMCIRPEGILSYIAPTLFVVFAGLVLWLILAEWFNHRSKDNGERWRGLIFDREQRSFLARYFSHGIGRVHGIALAVVAVLLLSSLALSANLYGVTYQSCRSSPTHDVPSS